MTQRRVRGGEEPVLERDTERLLADWLHEEAPAQEPPLLLPATLARTALTRRRPAWRVRDWWRSVLGLENRPRPPMLLSVGFVALLAALTLLTLLVLVPGGDRAQPTATIVVAADGSGDFRTVTEAVDEAAPGTTILIRPGEYREAIDTNKALVFRGDGAAADDVVIGAVTAGAPVIRVTDADTTFEHLTIRPAGPPDAAIYPESAFLPFGIHVVGGAVQLIDVGTAGGIGGAGCGLVLEPGIGGTGAASVVRGSAFRGGGAGVCGEPAGPLAVSDSSFEGLATAMRLAGQDIEIAGNAFSGNAEGLLSTSGEDLGVVVAGNTFEGNGTAVRLIGAAADISGNTFSGDDVAIKLTQTEGTVADNALSGIGSLALDLQSTDASVERNTIRSGGDAIRIIGGAPALTGNDIEGVAGTAISVSGGGQPRIVDTRLCDNATDLDVPGEVDASVSGTLGCPDAPAN